MREVYHCSPYEYAKIDTRDIDLHKAIILEEQRQEKIESKKQEQKGQVKKLLNK